MVRPKWEVSDALGLCEATLQSDPSLPQSVKKTARALLRCRTAALGGHALRCNHCGHQELSYNSCRNRHCPKCQYSKREQWALDRERDVLPVKYHHVVFTLPAELHVLAKAHPRIVYHSLFSAAWKTIKTLAADPRWIGGQAGMVAILHTWGQTLTLHPHVHCLVPNGVWDKDLRRWIYPRKRRFLFPVRVMSKLFRGYFLDRLEKSYQAGSLVWESNSWQKLKDRLYARSFNVYTTLSFGGAQQIIRYLTRYTHRVAITNRRIVSVDEHAVRFRYRDYRDGRNKEMELSPLEFCRRFLQHVLPKGLSRIRHYGILSNRQRSRILPEILFYFSRRPTKGKIFNVKAYLKKTYNKDLDKCPACNQGDLLPYGQVFWVPIRGDPHGVQYTINIVPYHTN